MAEINLTEARRVLELTLAAYSDIRGRYWAAVYDSVYEYLTGTKPVTGYRNTHKREMLKAFTDAADAGWADGFPIDKEVPPMEAEQVALLTAEQNAELGYIELMWQRMAALKKEGDFDAIHEAYATADGYAKTLDRIYNEFKVAAGGTTMLTFVGEDGQESCADCRKYKNKRHKASWWVSHNAVPPNRDFECKGYRCQHVLVDDNGNLFTI